LLQYVYDRSRERADDAALGGRLVLCGSAMSVMTELLSGTKPLRGRAIIDLRLLAFDYRTARAYWQIADVSTALCLDACLGGAPGYRALSLAPSPQSLDEFDTWVATTLLNPGLALYSRSETEYLLREDPRITHRALYYDVLSAVARGASTPSQIGSVLQRHRSAMIPPLDELEASGYVRRDEDLLKARKPTVTVSDPVIRFNQLITQPQADLVERDRAAEAWAGSRPTFQSKILGPHFKDIAREWTRSFAFDEAGLRLGPVGAAEISDPAARSRHQIDVLALEPGARARTAGTAVMLIGEAKATIAPCGLSDLARLEQLRELLTATGHPADHARLALYSRTGFRPDLERVAAQRADVLLISLEALYGDAQVLGLG
jgi:hypothetical protein